MIRILFLAANPSDTTWLRLDREIRAIDAALRQVKFRDMFDLQKHLAVRVTDLQGYLLRYKSDIVHFSGHGSSASGLVLEDVSGNSHPVSPRALNRLFSTLKDNVKCVVLNACYSELQAQAIAEHIECVIGMSGIIGDASAIAFSTAFYQAIGFGKSVATAFELGCVQIDLENLGAQDIPKLLALRRDPKVIVFASGTRQSQFKDDSLKNRLEDREKSSALPSRQPFEPEMVLIPAGEFLMGSNPEKDPDAQDNEQPQKSLHLAEFLIARAPITNSQYKHFVYATYYRQPTHWRERPPPPWDDIPSPEHPVVNVSWYDASAYCHWLSDVTGQSYRLPSEAEWEKGARGPFGRIYPWGNQWNPKKCHMRSLLNRLFLAFSEQTEKSATGAMTASVGKHPQGMSPYGLLDMAGNVWEWTTSLYRFGYPYDPADGREDLEASKDAARVIRGGCFIRNRIQARCACRRGCIPKTRHEAVGFRVVISPADS
jgi:formylglycine-generating enzyme required for sulfatase activity